MVGRTNWIAPILLLAAVHFAAAQATDAIDRPRGTVISGVVRDSIAGTPLTGATVQLVGIDTDSRVARTAISDSLGAFTFAGVPAGRYSLGFFHPVLESLGIEPPVRELFILGDGEVRGDLATPSPERFREAVCGVAKSSAPGAIVVGVVRDARDYSSVAGAQVTGEWLELTITRKGMAGRFPHLATTTAPNGWYVLCDPPSPGTVSLRAIRDADSTDLLVLELPSQGVVQEDLYLAGARAGDTAQPIFSATSQLRAGDGFLTGTVVSAADGRPLPGARVGVTGGPQTRVNASGAWALGNAPVGSRMLEVRAVGYYPQRRVVNILPGAPPISIALSTLRAVLDTIRVSAIGGQLDGEGFEDRRRSGAGTYLTQNDISRRGAAYPSDIFKGIPGIKLEGADLIGARQIWMRGPYGFCVPTIFLDGSRMPGLTADDLDDLFRIREVAGIEIYSEASVPGQFREYMGAEPCGSIVIWRKWAKH